MIDRMRSHAASHSDSLRDYGFTGDPLRPVSAGYFGHLVWAGIEGSSGDGAPPAPPTGLTARAGSGSVALDWTDNDEDDLAGYGVYRSTTAGGPYTRVNAEMLTTSSYTDSGLTNGTTYHYVVRAIDDSSKVGESSSEASATPSAPVSRTYSPAGYMRTFGTVYNGLGALSRLLTNDSRRVEIKAVRSGAAYVAEIQPYVAITAVERSRLRKVAIAHDGNASGSSMLSTLAIYNHSTSQWETLDGPRRGVTGDRRFDWSNDVSPTDYVSATGEIRLSVKATATSSIRTRTDFVRFVVDY